MKCLNQGDTSIIYFRHPLVLYCLTITQLEELNMFLTKRLHIFRLNS